MDKSATVYVAGHTGLVGSAIVRQLVQQGYTNLVLKLHKDLDLRNQAATEQFFSEHKPEFVFAAAAKVGGIEANRTLTAEFIYDNIQIQNNIIHFSWKYGVKKLLFLSSNCVYPKTCPQPMREEYLMAGPVEPTNEPYAIAKIAGMKMCQAYNNQHGTKFISVMPASLYGPNDNFNHFSSHFVAALIRKFHEAKIKNSDEVILWGTGAPRREIMHVDDAARACLHLMNCYGSSEPINVGCGTDIAIKELALLISRIAGFKGNILFDTSKPDGVAQKLLDSGKMCALGWQPQTNLDDGLKETYNWYVKNESLLKVT